jgi:hypothetical protein
MANFRPRKRKPLVEALTGEQIRMLVEGPSVFVADTTADAAVIAAFGTVTAFRVIYEHYKDDLFKLAAPDKPWAWWAIEGPGIDDPPKPLRIVRWRSELRQVPPVMARQKVLEKVAK